jgi:hypothetical protein
LNLFPPISILLEIRLGLEDGAGVRLGLEDGMRFGWLQFYWTFSENFGRNYHNAGQDFREIVG